MKGRIILINFCLMFSLNCLAYKPYSQTTKTSEVLRRSPKCYTYKANELTSYLDIEMYKDFDVAEFNGDHYKIYKTVINDLNRNRAASN